jgi:hypothetical protein
MIAEGLTIGEATNAGLVTAQGTEKKGSLDVRYSALILPADSSRSGARRP